jgi:hypothetical protein
LENFLANTNSLRLFVLAFCIRCGHSRARQTLSESHRDRRKQSRSCGVTRPILNQTCYLLPTLQLRSLCSTRQSWPRANARLALARATLGSSGHLTPCSISIERKHDGRASDDRSSRSALLCIDHEPDGGTRVRIASSSTGMPEPGPAIHAIAKTRSQRKCTAAKGDKWLVAWSKISANYGIRLETNERAKDGKTTRNTRSRFELGLRGYATLLTIRGKRSEWRSARGYMG